MVYKYMKRQCSVLFLFGASLTEARGLLPVLQELEREPGLRLHCLVTRHIARDSHLFETQRFLRVEGLDYQTTGIDAPVCARKIIGRYMPDVIIMANDSGIVNRYVVRDAATLGIPTVLLQEAILNYIPVETAKRSLYWLLTHLGTVVFLTRAYLANDKLSTWWDVVAKTIMRKPLMNRAYGFRNVSFFCVLSEFDAENFLKSGSRAQRFVVTGIPGLVNSRQTYEPSSERDYDFVLFTSCESQFYMTSEAQSGLYHDLVDAIRQVKPDAKIGLKLHPRENRRVFNALSGIEYIDSMESALSRGKVMVGTVSTVLFETLLSGYPTVMYLPASTPWLESFLTDSYHKLGIVADNKHTLLQLLESSQKDLEQEPHIVSFRDLWKKRLQDSATLIKNVVLNRGSSL
jgi:hypothetical protein